MSKAIRGDLFGGLSAGIVALPLAMALGVESGLGATAGLVGAIVLSITTAFIGGTKLMISGPTAAMTVVSSLIIANELERAASQEAALTTIFVIFLLAGALQVLLGLLGAGKYIRFVPYPLISGFMSGIGIVMVIIQVFPLIGHAPDINVLNMVTRIGLVVQQINPYSLSLGIFTILIIYSFPYITKIFPSTLAALVIVSGIAYLLPWKTPTLGDVSNEWMTWHWNHLLTFDRTQWDDVLAPAMTLALLGSIDTLLTSLVVDMVSGSSHKSNKELIGQGAGNMLTAIAGGLPGAGAIMRTMISVRSGAKTKWASLVHCAFLLFFLIEASNIIHFIPFAVLAGILITVGISIIDYKGLRDILRIPKSDALVMVVVMGTTIFVGLLQAFAAGIILASLSFVKKMADQSMTKTEPLLLMPNEDVDLANIEPIYLSREVFIQELSGPLFFGFAFYFKEALQALPLTRAVIFRMERVPFIDQSGLYALQDVLKQLKQKHIILFFTGLQDEPRQQLIKISIIPKLIPEQNIFKSFTHAADTLEQYLQKNPSNKLKRTNLQRDLDIEGLDNRRN